MSLFSAIRGLSLPAILAILQPGIVAQLSTIAGVSPPFGVYFGKFDNGQGRWGMVVSWVGEGHFDFIGRFPGEDTVIRSSPDVGDLYAGNIKDVAPYVGGAMGGGDVIGAGWLPYGLAFLSGPAHFFNGLLDRSEGPGLAYAGYWRWSDGRPYLLETTLDAVVGPSGTTLVNLKTPYLGDEDGMTTIEADGSFTLTLSGGTRVSARIDRSTAKLDATVMRENALAARPGAAANFSTLASVGTTDLFMYGFTIAGGTGKRLLFRAVGSPLPDLLGPGSYLTNPKIEILHGLDPVAANDDWDGGDPELRDAIARVGALPLSPGSKDSAFITTLPPGNYVMTVGPSVRGGSGTVLSEIFDLEPDKGSLLNFSALGPINPGAGGLISGFVILGNQPQSVLIRAVGLTLADPWLEVKTSSGLTVAANDNWSSSDSRLEAATAAAGTFRLDPSRKDAALLATLTPGAYTATVRGADGRGGMVLLEIYNWEGVVPLTKASLQIDAFTVTTHALPGDRVGYWPHIHLIETGGVSAATVTQVRFGISFGSIPPWDVKKTIPAGGDRELIETAYGDPEFEWDGYVALETVSVAITFRDSNGNEDTISASARVTR